MALFSKEPKETPEEKERKLLEKYGVANLNDPEDVESMKIIARELSGSVFMEAGLKLSMAKAEATLPITYQRAIMEQNFIIIRQLDRITKLLSEK